MKKNSLRGYIILSIIFVVFSVISFVVPFPKDNYIFWISYIFAVVAIVAQIYIFRISFSGDSIKSKFYGFPIARIGVTYLIVQLVLSIIDMAIATFIPPWIVIIINVIIVAFVAIGCITTEGIKEEIERQDTILKANVSTMRELQSLSASMTEQGNDNTKKYIEDLCDEFKYSDPVSCIDSKVIENQLKSMLLDLQKSILDNDDSVSIELCKKIKRVLAERNRICKLNK